MWLKSGTEAVQVGLQANEIGHEIDKTTLEDGPVLGSAMAEPGRASKKPKPAVGAAGFGGTTYYEVSR